jgi:hypothetical protein
MTCPAASRGAVGDAVDEVAELAQGLELARAHVLGALLEDRAVNRLMLRGQVVAEGLDGGGADAAAGQT